MTTQTQTTPTQAKTAAKSTSWTIDGSHSHVRQK